MWFGSNRQLDAKRIDGPPLAISPEAMQVNLQYSEEHFTDLAAAVGSGQVVEIASADKPTLKLVTSSVQSPKRTAPRVLSTGVGRLRKLTPTPAAR
jgi:antitoxin (DNA-binding transcriptional repressor) of toxin-antitoxin stability system